MRRQGREKIIIPTKADRKLPTRELVRKYGISRITAWRYRTFQIDRFHVPAEKDGIKIEVPREVLDQLWKELYHYYSRKYNIDVQDYIQDTFLRIFEYYGEIKDIEHFRALAYKITNSRIRTDLKQRNNILILQKR